ncbi:DUF1289 domain-containing protein [Parashewanella curva]|uniref:DUF1289 domain-containing protein n=1 Tax=Parashewanella curva TaxID=2338552 RepID=A0A3L8PZU3_9GAMM|nr:DUF1289 domain-containing protein [Parashewanella curva]RLV60053.1 DUF1289 domain-containing protein [Parashewanella curva]
MQSPCVARCGLNDDDICMGCYRHITEIVNWGQFDDIKKSDILAKVTLRKQEFIGQENTQILSREKWLKAKEH